VGSEIVVAGFRRCEFAVHVAVRAELAVGVAAGVDFTQSVDVDVGVNLGGVDAFVAEHFLNITDVGTAAMHVGGAGMAPQMAGAGFVDAAALKEFFDPVADVGGTEARAVAAEEEGGFLRQVVEERAGFAEKTVEPGGGALADGEHAAFAVFAFAHDQGAGGGIVVAVVEVGHFAAADTGCVEEFEHGAVAETKRISGVGDGEESLDFLFAEGFRELGALFAGQVEIGGGVGWDDAGAAEPGEETADATEAGELGVGDERLAAARTAVVMEKYLIGFEIGAGEGGGIVGIARIRPCGELPQRPAVGIDGRLRVGAGAEVL
jgi:hypothetical protein